MVALSYVPPGKFMKDGVGHSPRLTAEEVWVSVHAFAGWLEKKGYYSYDPYDLWGTAVGLKVREMYYRKHPLGVPLVAPFLLVEVLCPWLRYFLVKRERYATADAQLALAFLNLYEGTRVQRYLEKAQSLAFDLLRSGIEGYSGHCWGYPFDWQNSTALWRKNTPFITATPYCFELLIRLYDVTGERRYLDNAASVAHFVADNLRDTPTGPEAAAGSYSPLDNTQVINASAYRAMVLAEAAERWQNEAYREKARRNLNFILQNQREDGAWLYAVDNPAESFIDHFHTCFVLKNLFKLNRRWRSEAVRGAIAKGWDYYRKELFEADDTPKSFAILPRRQISRLEMYNVAEAITLGTLLREEIPGAGELADRLARRAKEQYQLRAGHFITRTYVGGWRHTTPFLRWPQAQMFYAMTNFWAAIRPTEAGKNSSTQLQAKSDLHLA